MKCAWSVVALARGTLTLKKPKDSLYLLMAFYRLAVTVFLKNSLIACCIAFLRAAQR